jgi:hypothetical protein
MIYTNFMEKIEAGEESCTCERNLRCDGQPMYNCLAAENNNSMKLSRRISMIHERLRAINKATIKSIQVQYNILLCMLQKKSDGDIEMAE